MAHEVDAFEAQDEASRVMAAAFVSLPAHARLYPSQVVPALRTALEAAGLLLRPAEVPFRGVADVLGLETFLEVQRLQGEAQRVQAPEGFDWAAWYAQGPCTLGDEEGL